VDPNANVDDNIDPIEEARKEEDEKALSEID